jgi:hypothetical protein
LQNTKMLCRVIQNKRCVMLPSRVLHPHTAACTVALL